MKQQGSSRKGNDVAALLKTATDAHKRGALDEAYRLYEFVLGRAPAHIEALYLSGALLVQQGRHALALDRLKRCVALRPDHLYAAEALGTAALATGDAALAVTWLEKALAGRSDATLAQANLVRAYMARARADYLAGRLPEAERLCRKAQSLDPRDADAAYVLANVLRSQERHAEAAQAYEAAVALQPTHAAAFDEYGAVLFALGRLAEAERVIRRAIELAPEAANAYTNLGRLYFPDLAKAAWALHLHDRALALQPNHAEAHSNRGTALYLLGRFEEAVASHRKAIALKPAMAEAHNNLGNDLIKLGDVEGALAAYRAAIACAPDYADARLNAGITLLSVGRLAEGWQFHEHRWRATTMAAVTQRPFTQPRWDGSPPNGALLVWGEQGIGDEIVFGSMVPDLAEAGHQVVWEMNARLVPLVRRSLPSVTAIARSTPPDPATTAPAVTAQIPTASLGPFVRSDLASFPNRRSFLRADPDRAERYRQEVLGGALERLIGLSWVSKNPELGPYKTLALSALAPILRMPGVRFVDLQYGDTAAERAAVEQSLGVRVHHLPDLDLFKDVDGLASLLSACDLVISVSNTTAHLAGALGVPVWVLVSNGVGKLWYWGHDGEATPWYPSARLFRQSKTGSWDDAIAAVAAQAAS